MTYEITSNILQIKINSINYALYEQFNYNYSSKTTRGENQPSRRF